MSKCENPKCGEEAHRLIHTKNGWWCADCADRKPNQIGLKPMFGNIKPMTHKESDSWNEKVRNSKF